MKKVKRTPRNWFLLSLLSYSLVAVLMGFGMALLSQAPEIASRAYAFFYAFVAPFLLVKQVFIHPGNGKIWMTLGAVSLWFISFLWLLSRYLMEAPVDLREVARRQRLAALRPKHQNTPSREREPEHHV